MNCNNEEFLSFKDMYELLDVTRDTLRNLINAKLSDEEKSKYLLKKGNRNFISSCLIEFLQKELLKKAETYITQDDIDEYESNYFRIIEEAEEELDKAGLNNTSKFNKNNENTNTLPFWSNMDLIDPLLVRKSFIKWGEINNVNPKKIKESVKDDIRNIVYHQVYGRFKEVLQCCTFVVQSESGRILIKELLNAKKL